MSRMLSVEYGAKRECVDVAGDGVTKDTKSLQCALDTCGVSGGGLVRVYPGRYLTGPLQLRSNVTLHLEAGATLLGSTDIQDYPIITCRYASMNNTRTLAALIYGENLENVRISGQGTIDGQGMFWWKPYLDWCALPETERGEMYWLDYELPEDGIWNDKSIAEFKPMKFRPRLVEPIHCRNVTIEGVTLQNSGFWNLHPLFCQNVRLRDLNIINPWEGPNTDGIDVDSCRDVFISGCNLDVGDDGICLKSGLDDNGAPAGQPTENVVISDCIVHKSHGAFVIGTEISGGIRNVSVSNCVFNGTARGIRIKCRRQQGGLVENISAGNLVMDHVACPFDFEMHNGQVGDEGTASFRNLRFQNIVATRSVRAGRIHGVAFREIQDVSFNNVRIEAKHPVWRRHMGRTQMVNLDVIGPDGRVMKNSFEEGTDVFIDPLI